MSVKSENGFALIAALMVLIMMFILSMALVYKVNTSVKTSSNWQNSQQSFIAAEAGIQAANRYIKTQLDESSTILNSQPVYGESGFNDQGFPLNGCLDYHSKQTNTSNGKLKSLTNNGSLQTNSPFEDAQFYYWFPEKISGNTIIDNDNCDSPENYQSLWCEMDLDNATIVDPLNNSFKNYGFSYFITSLGNFESISGKKGEELSSSSNQSQKKDYFFKIIACGVGPNARNTIETISNFEK